MKRDGDEPAERTRRVLPGRIRAERGEGRGLLLRKVSARVRRREGRSPSRGRALSRPGYGPGSRQQRSIVKLQYVANRTAGGWRAHGRYLAREGAQREGEKGLGFDATEHGVEIDRRLDGWQRAEDPRMWKLILSPERGEALDLVEHTRRVLGAMERDLGTRLEWVAIDHHNTDNPHVHVAIRGRDEAGRPLLLDREYVKHGVRARSRELATQALGYRTEADRVRARERGIAVRRFGELDAALEARMGPGRLVSFEDPVPASPRVAQLRLQLIGRLQFLERLGLAHRAGARTWRLALDHRPALREMQLLGDVQKSLGREGLGITDPEALRELVRLAPGVTVRGRVAGTAPSELGEAPFLVLEATDGRVLLIPQTPAMEERRGEGGLRRGHVVTLREHEAVGEGRRVRWTEIQEHGRLRDLVRSRELATVLDLEALERARQAARAAAQAPPPRRGFARAWARALAGRREGLARAGLLVRAGPESERGGGPSWIALPQAEPQVALQAKQRDRSSLSFAEAEQLAGREIEHANADTRHHDGRLVASVHDEQGRRFLVLDVGWRVVAIPSQRRDLQIGSRVAASLERTSSERGRESQMTWQVRDREQERDRGRGR
jgi:type IV secretory pathway VirD2 relaxase